MPVDSIKGLTALNNARPVYFLSVEDVQSVSNNVLNRNLSPSEMERVEEKIGDHISWYDAIESSIKELVER